MKQQPERTANCEQWVQKACNPMLSVTVTNTVAVAVLVSGPGKQINEVFMWLPQTETCEAGEAKSKLKLMPEGKKVVSAGEGSRQAGE